MNFCLSSISRFFSSAAANSSAMLPLFLSTAFRYLVAIIAFFLSLSLYFELLMLSWMYLPLLLSNPIKSCTDVSFLLNDSANFLSSFLLVVESVIKSEREGLENAKSYSRVLPFLGSWLKKRIFGWL